MAVQGYATIQSKSSGNQLHTLMVFDGWNEYVRYLNLDFGNWTDLRGTTSVSYTHLDVYKRQAG